MVHLDYNLKYLMRLRQMLIDQGKVDSPESNELMKQIDEYIYENRKDLSIDFILEGLASIGDAPSLLYDDEGHWAIGMEGIQNVGFDFDHKDPKSKANFDSTWFLNREDWKDSIREAIVWYLRRK